jgi:uncharacterized membrane protein (UPF0127 family)
MKYVTISNLTREQSKPIRAKYCQSFLCQLRGLMFTPSLAENQGVLLVQSSDNRVNASIHMMFMWMDLAVVWIDSEYQVVDVILARRWKMAYVPKKPARYVLEAGITHLHDFQIGDRVHFTEIRAD